MILFSDINDRWSTKFFQNPNSETGPQSEFSWFLIYLCNSRRRSWNWKLFLRLNMYISSLKVLFIMHLIHFSQQWFVLYFDVNDYLLRLILVSMCMFESHLQQSILFLCFIMCKYSITHKLFNSFWSDTKISVIYLVQTTYRTMIEVTE